MNSTTLTVGMRAPSFAIPDETGRMVELQEYLSKKNVALFFYPGDLTPGCSMQLAAIRDEFAKFSSHDTVVFGINHADAVSHAAFKKKCSLPFSLLTDAGRHVSAKYDATKKVLHLCLIRRTVVIVDKQGIIVYLKHGMPKNSEILKAIK